MRFQRQPPLLPFYGLLLAAGLVAHPLVKVTAGDRGGLLTVGEELAAYRRAGIEAFRLAAGAEAGIAAVERGVAQEQSRLQSGIAVAVGADTGPLDGEVDAVATVTERGVVTFEVEGVVERRVVEEPLRATRRRQQKSAGEVERTAFHESRGMDGAQHGASIARARGASP